MNKLTDDELIRLLTGRGMWYTAPIDNIPVIQLCDGPYGLRKQNEDFKSNNDSIKATCFPTTSAIACSFNRSAIAQMAEAIANECWNEKVSVILGPGINIKRSPLCGRNFEYFSEDPYLAGEYGISYVKAVQNVGIATSLKHFCLNNQETKRMISNSVVDERALREIYLKAFEKTVKDAKPATIMASYNKIDGVYATENKRLLTDILRKEWNYQGLVVSDWGACCNLEKAIKAGMDLEMPDSNGLHARKLKKAVKNGTITMQEIETSANRVLNLINTYNFDPISCKKDISNNHNLAIHLESESAVLLENDGILPLKNKNVTIIGALAENVRYQGGGSSHINTTAVNAINALTNKGFIIQYSKGYNDYVDVIDNNLEQEAINIAKESNTILFFGGLPDFAEGEGYDRKTYEMPNNQKHLLDELIKINKNIIFISFSGAPYNMYFSKEVRALLQMYLGGEGVMEALALLLTGEVSPSGRLAETIPNKISDTPCYETFAKEDLDVMYKESIYVGYRYYDTFNVKVRYPFGYGLSYSKFIYSDMKLSTKEYSKGKLEISFKIKNIGSIKASTSTLLFVENDTKSFIRERQSLKGFTKIELDPNEEKECRIILNEESFNIYDTNKGYLIPSGKYIIKLCGAINEVFLKDTIDVLGVDYKTNDLTKYPKYFDKENKLKNITNEEFLNIYNKPYTKSEFFKGKYDVSTPLTILAKHSLLGKIILRVAINECHKMVPGKPDTDPELMMNLEAVKEGTLDSLVSHAGGSVGERLEDAIVLSANGHKFKSFIKLIRG